MCYWNTLSIAALTERDGFTMLSTMLDAMVKKNFGASL
jgi:hypothetical protein